MSKNKPHIQQEVENSSTEDKISTPKEDESSTKTNYKQQAAGRNLAEVNKQEQCLEAENPRRKHRHTKLSIEEKMKMTSPRRVKIGANQKNKKLSYNSPGLKRLKPPNFAKMLPRTNSIQNELKNSPFNFKKLLSSWEDLSTRNLTSAVTMTPKSAKFANSQLGRLLEKVRVEKKLKMLGQPSESSLDAKVEASPKS